MKKNSFFIIFSISVSFFVQNSFAAQLSHADIEDIAADAVNAYMLANTLTQQKFTVSAASLDSRIRIKNCHNALTTEITENSNRRNINVKVACPDDDSWFLYIPVKVKTLSPVLVAKTNLKKGSVITTHNVGVEYLADHKIRGEVLDQNTSVLGARLKRNIRQGAAIYNKFICLVCEGEKVTIIAKGSDFSIKSDGIAMENATIGEQVEIKNIRSGKIVFGRVTAMNKVVINL